MNTASNLKAFTLIELLMVLAIISIIAAIATPSLTDYKQKADDEILLSTVINTLEFAHQTAMVSHKNTGVKFDSQRMILFTEPQATIVVKNLPLKSGTLFWRAYPRYREYLLFRYHGDLLSDNATIWYCHKNASQPSWVIVLSKFGEVRRKNPDQSVNCRDSLAGV